MSFRSLSRLSETRRARASVSISEPPRRDAALLLTGADRAPDWLEEWSHQIGAELKDGMRERPSWIAFARENGTVYHTYTVMAPDPFVAPPRAWRKDEYPD